MEKVSVTEFTFGLVGGHGGGEKVFFWGFPLLPGPPSVRLTGGPLTAVARWPAACVPGYVESHPTRTGSFPGFGFI